MALHKLVRSNYGRKLPVSIKYENLHSFKEGVILLCQSILETKKISHLHGSTLFTIPLRTKVALSLEYDLLSFSLLTVHHLFIWHCILKDYIGRNVWNLGYGRNLEPILDGGGKSYNWGRGLLGAIKGKIE